MSKELADAAAHGNVATVQRCLQHGDDPNFKSGSEPILHIAIMARTKEIGGYRTGALDCIQLLLDHGVDVDARDKNQWTPLLTACQTQDVDIIDLLLSFGADINARDHKGWGILHYLSVQKGNATLLPKFVEAGVDIDLQSYKDKNTALMFAIRCGDLFAVKVLISLGANLDLPNFQGLTPLHYAVEKRDLQSLVVLVEHGANMSAQIYEHKATPLHIAASISAIPIVDFLLKAGACTTLQDSHGRTPTDTTQVSGHSKLAEKIRSYRKEY